MKKLLGFFSVLGLASTISASSATGFAENNYDWSTPATSLESVAKLIDVRAFSSKDELDSFMSSEVFERFPHVIKDDADTMKPRDIVLTYEDLGNGTFNFKASMYVESNSTLILDETTAANKVINITII